MDKFLKWLPTVAGAALFLTGLVLKIIQGPKSYDEFISGNSYILLIIGIEAILLNFAFSSIINESAAQKE